MNRRPHITFVTVTEQPTPAEEPLPEVTTSSERIAQVASELGLTAEQVRGVMPFGNITEGAVR